MEVNFRIDDMELISSKRQSRAWRRLLEIDVHNILAKVQNIIILNDNRDNLFFCVVKEILIAIFAC